MKCRNDDKDDPDKDVEFPNEGEETFDVQVVVDRIKDVINTLLDFKRRRAEGRYDILFYFQILNKKIISF